MDRVRPSGAPEGPIQGRPSAFKLQRAFAIPAQPERILAGQPTYLGANSGTVLPLEIQLPDGELICVRHVTPADREGFARGFRELSPESLDHRFHSHGFSPRSSTLDYLTRVDQVRHLAICATVLLGGEERGIGVARCIRTGTGTSAELAVTVVDAYQGRGVAAILVGTLSQLAREQGVEHFSAYVEAERRKLLVRLNRIGARITRIEEGVAQLTIPLATITSRSSEGYRSGSA